MKWTEKQKRECWNNYTDEQRKEYGNDYATWKKGIIEECD